MTFTLLLEIFIGPLFIMFDGLYIMKYSNKLDQGAILGSSRPFISYWVLTLLTCYNNKKTHSDAKWGQEHWFNLKLDKSGGCSAVRRFGLGSSNGEVWLWSTRHNQKHVLFFFKVTDNVQHCFQYLEGNGILETVYMRNIWIWSRAGLLEWVYAHWRRWKF